MNRVKHLTNLLQEFSIPLIAGVIAGLVVANIDEHLYHAMVHWAPFGEVRILGHELTAHFLINDIFMVLFFGLAAKEITESVLPGGALNPVKKALNPLLGTLGGVLGPIGVFFLLTYLIFGGSDAFATVAHGWGIPTATDIALAWLAARLIFGKGHSAVNFLLLLAVADDALGLGIIAIFYPNPEHPVEPLWLLLTGGGMAVAFAMRRFKVRSWWPYVAVAGTMSWLGLIMASLHPALALVAIVPFLPGPDHDLGLFVEDDSEPLHSPLERFEHQNKALVDFGLFFFAFANAGVEFANVSSVTVIVLASLIFGKSLGVFTFSGAASLAGFSLPDGMNLRHLAVAGLVASLGLTVALFVAGEAFPGDSVFQGPAKMGAVFSVLGGVLAYGAARLLRLRKAETADEPSSANEAPDPLPAPSGARRQVEETS